MVYSIQWYIYIGSMNVRWIINPCCLFTRRLLFGLGIWDSILIVSNSATTTFWTRINYFWRLPTLCIFMISIWRRRRYGKYVFFYIYESQIKDIMHVRDRFCACKIIVEVTRFSTTEFSQYLNSSRNKPQQLFLSNCLL